MGHYLFQQLRFAREATIEYVKGIDEKQLEIVPEGLNNNIKWNIGHIYMVMEKFAFQLTGEKAVVPNHFPELFNPGTSPKDWAIETPTIEELNVLLNVQQERMEANLSERLAQPLQEIYHSSTGLQISSIAECLSFCLYHEGMHFGAIKGIHQRLKNKD
ncbi:DinB family protein [Bacillus sp. CLL-7-23]|uniref:DinB family protein n=1 Tax=Bacillus changyiensis TaxID=3004103 RepID=A0ABT4X7W3_9BACI|nr:DinB family protein [Bacillus changyiensis]MDA7028328.1 DinB family protein [Bacillus changyiensis]